MRVLSEHLRTPRLIWAAPHKMTTAYIHSAPSRQIICPLPEHSAQMFGIYIYNAENKYIRGTASYSIWHCNSIPGTEYVYIRRSCTDSDTLPHKKNKSNFTLMILIARRVHQKIMTLLGWEPLYPTQNLALTKQQSLCTMAYVWNENIVKHKYVGF